MNNLLFSPKPLAVVVAGLGLASIVPVQAAIIDGLSAAGSAAVFTDPAVTDGPNTTTPTTSAFASDTDTDGSGNTSTAAGNAFGNVSGVYGVGASGDGVFDATGHFIRSWSITNDTGVAQNYSFVFYVYGGSMSADAQGASGSGYAEYTLGITWGANSLFASHARINSDGTYSQTGTALDGATHSGTTYFWSGTHVGLNLGVLNPGESSLLQYDLLSHAFGDYGFDAPDPGYGCYGGVPTSIIANVGAISEFGCTGTSRAFMGDPSGVNNNPVVGPPHVTNTPVGVPLPGSLALLGAGLLAAFGVRVRTRPR